MNKLALIAAAALTAATFGGVALAQDAKTTTPDFKTVDANADGMITWEEAHGAFPTLTEDLFKKADANSNGSLDEGEFTTLVALVPGSTDANAPAKPQ